MIPVKSWRHAILFFHAVTIFCFGRVPPANATATAANHNPTRRNRWWQSDWSIRKNENRIRNEPITIMTPNQRIIQFFRQRQCHQIHQRQQRQTQSTTLNNNDNDDDVWVYTGTVFDLMNGYPIAHVQGLELLAPIISVADCPSSGTTTTQLTRLKRRCQPCQIRNILASPSISSCETYFSRKLFCYTTTTTTTSNDDTQKTNHSTKSSAQTLLTTLPRRPGRPQKYIPIDQTVTAYDSIVSLIQSSSSSSSDDDSENTPMLLHSQFITNQQQQPQHQRKSLSSSSTWSLVSYSNSKTNNDNKDDVQTSSSSSSSFVSNDDDVMEFSVISRLQQRPIQPKDVSSLLSAATSNNNDENEKHSKRKKRVAWIQFGGGASASSSRGTPMARETYRFRSSQTTANKSPASLSKWEYTRFDEAPVWYAGPRARGVVCQWKLKARKCLRSEIDTHVPVAAELAKSIRFFGNNDDEDRQQDSLLKVFLNQQNRHHDMTNTKDKMENAFQYYADALHPAMVASFDLDHTDDNDYDGQREDEKQRRQYTTTTTTRDTFLPSCAAYREFYQDLVVRRTLARLLCHEKEQTSSKPGIHVLRNPFQYQWKKHTPPVDSIRMKPFSSSSSQSVSSSMWHSVQSVVHSTWVWVDRIRAASTISIGGGGERD